MKRILFPCLLCCLASVTRAQIEIRPTAGINITDFSMDPQNGTSSGKVGYQLGGSVAFGKKFFIEPGFFYVRKSSQVAYADSVREQNIDFDISGLRIPLTLGINVVGTQKSMFGFRLFGGGAAFILTQVKDLDKDDFKDAQFGVYAGAGIKLGIMFLDASYEWSLSNVQEKISQVDIGQSRTFFVQTGFRIPL